ncbi:MAG: DUF4124 domain-containing protein [Salinisphaeraceae bacterium]
MNRYALGPLALLALCLPLDAASQLYRWTDESGETHFGDRIPPEYARGERAVLNANGDVLDRMPAEPSRDQLAALEAERDRARREAAERARQAAYDRSLTATYASLDHLDIAYRDRLDLLDARLSIARQSLGKLDAQLARARQAQATDADIRATATSQQQQTEAVARLKQRRDALAQRHRADRQRYLALTSGNDRR